MIAQSSEGLIGAGMSEPRAEDCRLSKRGATPDWRDALDEIEAILPPPGEPIVAYELACFPREVSRILESNESLSVRFDISTRNKNGGRRSASEAIEDVILSCHAILRAIKLFT